MTHPHLLLAERAVAYVNGLSVISSNRDAQRQPDTDARIATQNMAYFNTETPLDTKLKEIKRRAELGVQHGVGNCEIKASMAFDYLARQPGRPKIEIMSLDANGEWPATIAGAVTGIQQEFFGPDHVFVVLGRISGNIRDFTTWNWQAVICDPWAKRAYPAHQFSEEMALIRSVSGGQTATVQGGELLPNQAW